jgi:Zn ribbon nucleic-acid-binding protein
MAKTRKTFKASKGHCPVCNSTDLDYDEQPEFYADTHTFTFECKKCGTVGREENGEGFIGFHVDASAYFMGSKSARENGDDDMDAQFVFDGEEVVQPVLARKNGGK